MQIYTNTRLTSNTILFSTEISRKISLQTETCLLLDFGQRWTRQPQRQDVNGWSRAVT